MNHIIWLVVKWIPPDCHCHLPGKSQPNFSHVIVSCIYWSQFTLCALQNISLKDKIPVFAFQIMQNTLSPYWAEVYAGRRDICAILLDVPRCFSTEVGHGIFAVWQALLSCALGSGNVAYLEQTENSLSLSAGQIRFLRLQDKNNSQYMVNNQPLDPNSIIGNPPCSDPLWARLTRVLPTFNLVHILLEHNR